jgi:hypothetical protein
MLKHLENHKILTNLNHGFRSGYSCTRQLLVTKETVLGPLLFLFHINDLPECVKSQVRIFADDGLLYREIKSQQDHQIF